MTVLDFYGKGSDRPWPNPRLTTASIVGHVTHKTARVWVRVWEPGTYWLVVSDAPIPISGELAIVSTGTTRALTITSAQGMTQSYKRVLEQVITFETDLTSVFNISTLKPGSKYYYALLQTRKDNSDADATPRWEVSPDSTYNCFQTQDPKAEKLTFGLFSCHMPYKKNADVVNLQMWERFGEELSDRDADFVIGGGDQAYTDGNKDLSIWRFLTKVKGEISALPQNERHKIMLSWYRDIYRGYWGIRPLRRVFSKFPVYMIWDDHEIMDGWGSHTKKELSNLLDSIWEWENPEKNLNLVSEMFGAAKQAYMEYEHSHNPDTVLETWDYSFSWGSAAFYVLDMRGQRDFNRKTDDKILGRSQMNRFAEWARSEVVSNAKAVFVVSPVPVVHANEFLVNHLDLAAFTIADDLRDEWEHDSNWAERNQVLDHIFRISQEQEKIVAILSGDVHIGAAFRLSRNSAPKARVYQLTSSGITYPMPAFLKLLVKKGGVLGDDHQTKKANPTTFKLLHTLCRNNFGIVQVHTKPDIRVTWDLYGSTGEEDEIVRLKRIDLD
ncbi:MAG: alkaline phosphatase family protein [Planctomycetes bacterium]|nr:alkaline phosphatase family protein [Planctomycetota bacterium]